MTARILWSVMYLCLEEPFTGLLHNAHMIISKSVLDVTVVPLDNLRVQQSNRRPKTHKTHDEALVLPHCWMQFTHRAVILAL